VRLLLVSGSLRQDSYNRALLSAAVRALPRTARGVELEGIARLPAYSEDLDGELVPREVRNMREWIAASDALLIATPEYNGSIPGALKNAIDWASRPWPDCVLREKLVAVIGASTGLFGAVWAQAELRKVLRIAGANVLDCELVVGLAHESLDFEGSVVDETISASLREVVTKLIDHSRSRNTEFSDAATR
jgi:chromate reductase